MKVLVTGASGYIGRVTCRYLLEHGHAVTPWLGRVVDLTDTARVYAKVNNGWAPEAVVHLAGRSTVRESFTDPLGYFDTNSAGTMRLLRALERRHARVPFVLASTSAVYGNREGALTETMAPGPDGPYASSKFAAEDLVRWASAAGMVSGMVLRLFNVAGVAHGVVDQSQTRIVGNVVRAAAGLIPHVSVNGDGSVQREFTHVLDVVEAIRLALECARPGEAETLNIGSGVPVSMNDVIRTVETVCKSPVPVEYRPAVSEPQSLVSDPRRAADVLDWCARHDLASIVASVWEHRDQLG